MSDAVKELVEKINRIADPISVEVTEHLSRQTFMESMAFARVKLRTRTGRVVANCAVSRESLPDSLKCAVLEAMERIADSLEERGRPAEYSATVHGCIEKLRTAKL